MKYVIGIDIGTQGAKAVLVNVNNGLIIATSSNTHSVDTPGPLCAEQNGDMFLHSAYEVLEQVLKNSSVSSSKIKGIGISSLYGGSGIPVDANLNPIHPCLIWMDRRAEEEVVWIKKHIDLDILFDITGNSVNSYFGFTKMMWLKKHRPEVWKKTKYFLPPNSFVIQRMTGEIVVDYSSAGNIGGVYDIKNHCWSDMMIKSLGLDRTMFPNRLVESSEIVGTLLPEIAKKFGLSAHTVVVGGGVDAPVSLLATGINNHVEHVAMMGTSTCWGYLTNANALISKELVSMPYVLDGKNTTYVFGGTSTSGALVTWFINNFFDSNALKNNIFSELETYLLDTKPGAEGLITLPYFAGERSPIWDAHSSGVFFGLGLYHNKKHIYRSILESTAFSLLHNMEQVKDIGLSKELIVVGGTSKSRGWLQIIADIIQCPVSIIKEEIEAPLGSAVLAALGTKCIDNANQAKDWVTLEKIASPNISNIDVYQKLYNNYKEIYESTKSNMRQLKAL